MPKTVVHLFHDDADSIRTGIRVAQRIAEVATERGVEVEVFCFGPAERLLAGPGSELSSHLADQIHALTTADVPVSACASFARADGTEDVFQRLGVELVIARDAFIRYTLEGATVITF